MQQKKQTYNFGLKAVLLLLTFWLGYSQFSSSLEYLKKKGQTSELSEFDSEIENSEGNQDDFDDYNWLSSTPEPVSFNALSTLNQTQDYLYLNHDSGAYKKLYLLYKRIKIPS